MACISLPLDLVATSLLLGCEISQLSQNSSKVAVLSISCRMFRPLVKCCTRPKTDLPSSVSTSVEVLRLSYRQSRKIKPGNGRTKSILALLTKSAARVISITTSPYLRVEALVAQQGSTSPRNLSTAPLILSSVLLHVCACLYQCTKQLLLDITSPAITHRRRPPVERSLMSKASTRCAARLAAM